MYVTRLGGGLARQGRRPHMARQLVPQVGVWYDSFVAVHLPN